MSEMSCQNSDVRSEILSAQKMPEMSEMSETHIFLENLKKKTITLYILASGGSETKNKHMFYVAT